MNLASRLYKGQSPLAVPAYSIGEAAGYLDLPPGTVRSWLVGNVYSSPSGRRPFKRVISMADPKNRYLSFQNLIELYVLSALRRSHGVRLAAVRRAIDFLKAKSEHPLADREILTDNCDVFVEEYGNLISASQSGQLAMKSMLSRYLQRIARSPKGAPIRLYPYTTTRGDQKLKPVAIDPTIQFGRPCIAGTGIPTAVLAERYRAGDTIQELAEDYGRSAKEIEEAIRFEFKAA